MLTEEKLRELWLSSPYIAEKILPARITFERAPKGADDPFIVATRVSTAPQETNDENIIGSSRLDIVDIQVTCYGRTNAEAGELAEAIRRTTTNDPVLRATCTGMNTDHDNQTDLFGRILTFSLSDRVDSLP
jgi:hypothetical protein